MYVVGVHVCMMYFVCGACTKVCVLVNPSRDQRRELVVFLYGFAPRCLETETITEWGVLTCRFCWPSHFQESPIFVPTCWNYWGVQPCLLFRADVGV